jgi:heme oxygenase
MPSDLAARLRAETAELHKATETTVGVPGQVQTRAQYDRLLRRLIVFYSSAQSAMEAERWREDWVALDIDIASFSRVALLEADLAEFEPSGDGRRSTPLQIDTFGSALGCLYVVEGSSLGGIFIGPAIRRILGKIPTSFYDGSGRGHPKPWRRVQAALASYDLAHSDVEDVIRGAANTFVRFGEIAATGRWASA